MFFFNAPVKYNKTFVVDKDANEDNKKKILDYLQTRFAHTNISIQLK
jgi:hypothetical protein